MAKSANVLIKLLSSAGTGYFYVTKKNAKAKPAKMALKKYDPVLRKHVEFKEAKNGAEQSIAQVRMCKLEGSISALRWVLQEKQ